MDRAPIPLSLVNLGRSRTDVIAPASGLINEAAGRCFVRQRPAEIDFGLDDFAAAHRQNFRIAKALAPGRG